MSLCFCNWLSGMLTYICLKGILLNICMYYMYNMLYLKGVIFRAGFIGTASSTSANNICYQVLHEGVASILLINTVTSHLLSSVVEIKGKNLQYNTSVLMVRNRSVLSTQKALISFKTKQKKWSMSKHSWESGWETVLAGSLPLAGSTKWPSKREKLCKEKERLFN